LRNGSVAFRQADSRLFFTNRRMRFPSIFIIVVALGIAGSPAFAPISFKGDKSENDNETRLLTLMLDQNPDIPMRQRYDTAVQQLGFADQQYIASMIFKSKRDMSESAPKCPIHIPEFSCDVPKATPRDPDALLPRLQDIRLITAMGDSLTAGDF
jgi:hypothetical protein